VLGPVRIASETGTVTEEVCMFHVLQICSNLVWAKSPLVGEPGHPTLQQFSDSSIPSLIFPTTERQMFLDIVLRTYQSVLLTSVLVAFVLVFRSDRPKLGRLQYSQAIARMDGEVFSQY